MNKFSGILPVKFSQPKKAELTVSGVQLAKKSLGIVPSMFLHPLKIPCLLYVILAKLFLEGDGIFPLKFVQFKKSTPFHLDLLKTFPHCTIFVILSLLVLSFENSNTEHFPFIVTVYTPASLYV